MRACTGKKREFNMDSEAMAGQESQTAAEEALQKFSAFLDDCKRGPRKWIAFATSCKTGEANGSMTCGDGIESQDDLLQLTALAAYSVVSLFRREERHGVADEIFRLVRQAIDSRTPEDDFEDVQGSPLQ